MIVKRAGKYVVVSETTGRRFGTYDALAEARRRLSRRERWLAVAGACRPEEQQRR
jgi:hypothetical protein